MIRDVTVEYVSHGLGDYFTVRAQELVYETEREHFAAAGRQDALSIPVRRPVLRDVILYEGYDAERARTVAEAHPSETD